MVCAPSMVTITCDSGREMIEDDWELWVLKVICAFGQKRWAAMGWGVGFQVMYTLVENPAPQLLDKIKKVSERMGFSCQMINE